jgi:hypothetical protein
VKVAVALVLLDQEICLVGGIMSTATTASSIRSEPELRGQTVVLIGGSASIGLERARRARVEGAKLILTGRNPERLEAHLEFSKEITALLVIGPYNGFISAGPQSIDNRTARIRTEKGHCRH